VLPAVEGLPGAGSMTTGAVRCSAWLGVADTSWVLLYDQTCVHEDDDVTAGRIVKLYRAFPETNRPEQILLSRFASLRMFELLLRDGLPIRRATVPPCKHDRLVMDGAIPLPDIVRNC